MVSVKTLSVHSTAAALPDCEWDAEALVWLRKWQADTDMHTANKIPRYYVTWTREQNDPWILLCQVKTALSIIRRLFW